MRALLSLSAVIFLFILAPRMHAAEVWTGTSDVKFHGASTLHDFDGTVKQVPLRVTVIPGKNGRIVNATSDVEVKSMNTAEEKRDAAMWTMFQQAKYRFLKVEVK